MIRAAMTWGLLTARGDLDKFFKRLQDSGANALRFFLNFNEDDNKTAQPLTPYLPAGTMTVDGHLVTVWDLALRNPAFTARLKTLAAYFVKYKIDPWVVFDDLCSEGDDGTVDQFNDVYYSNPIALPRWKENIWQPRPAAGGNQALEFTTYREALEAEVLEIFKTAGCPRVFGDVKNEYGYFPGPAYSEEQIMGWYRDRVGALKRAGYAPILGSGRDPVNETIAAYLDIYDRHNVEDPEDVGSGLPASRVVLSTDGVDGDGHTPSAWGARTISVQQAQALGNETRDGGWAGFCMIFQEASDDLVLPQNLDAITDESWDALLAFSIGSGWDPPEPPPDTVKVTVCKSTGLLPNAYCPALEEREYIEGTEPTAPCAVHKAPEPEKPCSFWFWRLNFRRWLKCIFG